MPQSGNSPMPFQGKEPRHRGFMPKQSLKVCRWGEGPPETLAGRAERGGEPKRNRILDGVLREWEKSGKVVERTTTGREVGGGEGRRLRPRGGRGRGGEQFILGAKEIGSSPSPTAREGTCFGCGGGEPRGKKKGFGWILRANTNKRSL